MCLGIDLWCNGSTTDFGSVCRGSNPRRSTMKLIVLSMLITLLAGCNLFKGGSETASVSRPHDFPYPVPPTMMTSQEDIIRYLARGFWKPYLDSAAVWNVDSADSLIGGVRKNDMDEAMMNYLMLLWETPVSEAVNAQTALMERLAAYDRRFPEDSLYEYFAGTFHDALYDPVSELRNEEFYLPVIQSVIAREEAKASACTENTADGIVPGSNGSIGTTGELSENATVHRIRLETCLKNRIGEQLPDFTFTDIRGRQHSLYRTPAEYTLILFSNPGCPACAHIVAQLQQHPRIGQLTADGTLKLLNIYIDEDLEAWYQSVSDYPAAWLSGYNEDLSIRDGSNFAIRAIPSVYLLDRSKHILLKDVPTAFLMRYIERM